MKNIFFTMTFILFSLSSFALSTLSCQTQMLGKNSPAPQRFIAPILAGQGLNSVLRARHQGQYLYFNLNPKTVSESKAHVILDGRNLHIPMNVHLSAEEKSNIIILTLRDTETQKTETKEFELHSPLSMSLETVNATFKIECLAQY